MSAIDDAAWEARQRAREAVRASVRDGPLALYAYPPEELRLALSAIRFTDLAIKIAASYARIRSALGAAHWEERLAAMSALHAESVARFERIAGRPYDRDDDLDAHCRARLGVGLDAARDAAERQRGAAADLATALAAGTEERERARAMSDEEFDLRFGAPP